MSGNGTDQSEKETVQASEEEQLNDVLKLVRSFEGTRPMAIVAIEKIVFEMKSIHELDYVTVRNAMKQTDGELCLRYEDGYGHGYAGLVEDELVRIMKPDGFDKYNGPFGVSVELIEEWTQKGQIQITTRQHTAFPEVC